jgi:hypothetical protein
MGDREDPKRVGHEQIVPNAIPPVIIPAEDELLSFSFRHLDLEHPKFSVAKCQADYLAAFLSKIQQYSNWPVGMFCDQNNQDHRHIIWFPDTTEPAGFPNIDADQLAYHESWQFGISWGWRAHGILIGNIFYVVWLDPEHLLDP